MTWGCRSGPADLPAPPPSPAVAAGGSTSRLRPLLGGARPLAERSIGTPDPGAVSPAAVLEAVLDAGPGADSGPSGHPSGAPTR
ncbi:DAK2 domain-containing protein [Streptomyces bathyalis]|uniref:DAK2 domain-containing protein n=1 Tax=Streptomyces bathyalis TaxID=2710756 RepID=UPI001FED1D5B|nr:DAK2 domain-containing protein [Streptomyces bathyalis]